MIEAGFYWVPTVECNGAFASQGCGSNPTRPGCVTRNVHQALKFWDKDDCAKWCAVANTNSKAAWVPTQHGFDGGPESRKVAA
jgi:hypothetical protein